MFGIKSDLVSRVYQTKLWYNQLSSGGMNSTEEGDGISMQCFQTKRVLAYSTN